MHASQDSTCLPDRSTGASRPRLVQLHADRWNADSFMVADIDVLRDGYAATNDGTGDSTAGIQKALDDCSRNGGGTVFLPAGRYSIRGSIAIPAYVTLLGDEGAGPYGTVIEYRGEPDDDIASGTFQIGGSGGVIGLTVTYPDQSLDDVKPYPFTFYTSGAGDSYMLSTVKNCTVINGYRGIGACCTQGVHEQLNVEGFRGTFLACGAMLFDSADVGTMTDIEISNRFWAEADAALAVPVDRSRLDAYTRTHTTGLILADLEWTQFLGLVIDGCKTGIETIAGRRLRFSGSFYDFRITNCQLGLHNIDLDYRWGMVAANGVIEGGIVNETNGLVKLCNVRVTGEIVPGPGGVRVSEDDLSDCAVDFRRPSPQPVPNLFVVHAAKDGSTDVSAAVQTALDHAGAASGGIVYLPGGIYRFDHPLTVPANVELRGSSAVPTRDQYAGYQGTLFCCYDGVRTAGRTQAFITLSGQRAGLRGIRIRYPENTPYQEDRTTTYAVCGTASDVYVENCSIASAAFGIDFAQCDRFYIKGVTAGCYENAFRLGGTGGFIANCLQNGTVIQRCGAPGQTNTIADSDLFPLLFDRQLRREAVIVQLDGAEDAAVVNMFAYGCAVLLHCTSSRNVLCLNLGADNIGTERAQIEMENGSMSIVNLMRYNGRSFTHDGGTLLIANRITIDDKSEETYCAAR